MSKFDTDVYELFKSVCYMRNWLEHHKRTKFELSHHRAMLMTLDTLEKMLMTSKIEIKHNKEGNGNSN